MWCVARELAKRFSRFSEVEAALLERHQFEQKSRQEIAAYQLARFNELWQYACQYVPYYRQLQTTHTLPNTFESLDDIAARVPILEKKTAQVYSEQLVTDQKLNGFWTSTSGSTGTPLKYFWENEAYIESQRDKYYYQSLWGIDIWDKTANLWGYSKFWDEDIRGKLKFLKNKIIQGIRNKVELSVFQINPAKLDFWYDQIGKKRIKFLYALPNMAYLLAQHNQHKLAPPDLKLTVVGGEPIFPHQEKLIAEVLQCPVAIEYGTIEIGLLAASYPDHHIHICERGIILETVPLGSGMYEIIVTNLRNKGFPLIRYKIGDLTTANALLPEEGTAILDSVIGRTRDVFVSASGDMINGLVFSRVFKDIDVVIQYQVVQESIHKIVIRLVCSQPLSSIWYSKIESKLSQLLGSSLIIHIQEVEKIEPSAAGKHRFIISDLAAM